MTYEALGKDLTLAATGDALITLPLPPFSDPSFTKLVDRITATDVAFTNLETVLRRDEGYPQIEGGGATWIWSEPEILGDLQSMGFDLFSVAQNHMLDWGQDGLVAALRYLEEAGVVHAGAGRTLTEARRPSYMELPQGRVALIALTTTFHDWNRAGEGRSDCIGRPGINPLRIRVSLQVQPEAFATLKRLSDELFVGEVPPRVKSAIPAKSAEEIMFLHHRVRSGKTDEAIYELDAIDEAAIMKTIAEARRQADWVFLSVHSHEMEGTNPEATPAYLRAFSHRCIDAGVNAIFGHGAHVLRGIEVYGGSPILHGLGNLFFQNETLPYQPAEFYERVGLGADATPGEGFDKRSDFGRKGFTAKPVFWNGVVARMQWSAGTLTAIELDPVTLGHGLPRSVRGTPRLAEGEAGREVIDLIAGLSKPYGVDVTWDATNATGRVALG